MKKVNWNLIEEYARVQYEDIDAYSTWNEEFGFNTMEQIKNHIETHFSEYYEQMFEYFSEERVEEYRDAFSKLNEEEQRKIIGESDLLIYEDFEYLYGIAKPFTCKKCNKKSIHLCDWDFDVCIECETNETH